MVILMKLRKIIDNYVECNTFEIKIIDGKVKIYYYDKIDKFSSSRIVILKDNKRTIINGKKLVIETMFEEFIVISGLISSIELGCSNE